MMKRYAFVVGVVMLAVAAATWAAAAAQQGAGQRAAFGRITIIANHGMDFSLTDGTWSAANGVTIMADGTKIVADSMHLQTRKGSRDLQHAEAQGNIHITGTYAVAQPDGTKANWGVDATCDSATYEAGPQTAVLRGKVNIHATEAATGEVITMQAGQATYSAKTQQLHFEHAAEPVRAEWQYPQTKAGGK